METFCGISEILNDNLHTDKWFRETLSESVGREVNAIIKGFVSATKCADIKWKELSYAQTTVVKSCAKRPRSFCGEAADFFVEFGLDGYEGAGSSRWFPPESTVFIKVQWDSGEIKIDCLKYGAATWVFQFLDSIDEQLQKPDLYTDFRQLYKFRKKLEGEKNAV